jgi:lipase
VQLNVREWGDPTAPPVVCVHGLAGYGGRFRRLAEEYLPSKRLLAVDLRGHGGSGWDPPWDLATHAADLLETAAALGAARAAWVGHSIGGRLIAECAALAPERVERAVLLDPAMRIDPAVALERAELLRLDTSFATVDEAIDARLADPALFTTPRATLEAEAGEHLARGDDGRYRWRFCPPMAIVAWSEMTTAPPSWPTCPTLVVFGARSWIALDIPDMAHISKVTVPGGHSVMWDDFDATATTVAGFLS